jgi:hypothetical protein
MQQRRLRLGDILDDYCPRERRITNHVIVAMIDDDVRQTRCSTCDAEHEYKQAKAPAPRRKKVGALFQDVPEEARPRAVNHQPVIADEPIQDDSPNDIDSVPAPADDSAALSADAAESVDPDERDEDRMEDEGPVHRRLIRATLPRPEGHVPERKEPEFTMRQPGREANGNRPGHRPRSHRAARQAQGQQNGHNRFGGQRHGASASRQGSGASHGQGQHRQGNRPGQPSAHRDSGGRPGGQNRGPGRKRGR